MANINNAAGARIKGSLISANFNQLVHEYAIPASDSDDFFLNDFVKTNNTSEDGVPICVKTGVGEASRGIIVSFVADHIYENTTFREANTRRVALVCDDASVEFEIQATGTITSTDISKNADIIVASGNPSIGLSGTQLDQSTITTNNAQLKILRIVDDPTSELGQYTKLMCMIHEHELSGESGSGTDLHNNLLNLTYDAAGHGSGFAGFQRGTTISASDPTVNADSTLGYVKGDLWLNTTTKIILYCLDNAAGAAIWDAIEAGIHWQEAIINQVDFTSAEPAGPTIDDRYINTATGVGSVTAQAVTATYIYEWNGTNWSETIPLEGYAVWDKAANEYFIFNGTAWTPLGAVQSFLDLSDTPSSYATAHAVYKINSLKNAVVESSMTVDDAGNVNIPGKLTVVGAIDPTALILDPQGSAPSTDDGTTYYDSVDKEFKFRENGVWDSLNASVQQVQAYYIAKSGNDSNSGKNNNEAFLTIGAANSAIAARLPTITNPFVVYIIDGIYVEDFTMQPYTIYLGAGITYEGEIVANSTSSMTMKRWLGKTSGGTQLISKSVGGIANFTVIEDLTLNTSHGVIATAGTVNIEVDSINITNTDFIATGCGFSNITVHCANNILVGLAGTGSVMNLTGANLLNVQIVANTIIDSGHLGGITFNITGGVGTESNIGVYANRFQSGRKGFNIGNLTTCSAALSRFNEFFASTESGTGKLVFDILDDDKNGNKMRLKNSVGILLEGSTQVSSGTFSLPTGTAVNEISIDTSATGGTNSQLWARAAIQTAIATAPIGHQEKASVFFVNKTGNDSNGGKSEDDTLLTISAAIVKVNALSPTSANRFVIKVLGGGNYIESFTMPFFTVIEAGGIRLVGDIICSDTSKLIVGTPQAATFQSFYKNAGAGEASVEVVDTVDAVVGATVKCTSGTLNIVINNINVNGGAFVIPGSTGNINVTITGKVNVVGISTFLSHSAAGILRFFANEIVAGTGVLFGTSAVAGPIQIIANSIISGARAFNLAANTVVDLTCNYLEEVSSSVIDPTAEFNASIVKYHRTGDSHDLAAIVRNDARGVLVTSTKGTLFEAYLSADQDDVTGDSTLYTVIFDTEVEDRNNTYNNATGIFTAPVDGFYLFTMEVEIAGIEVLKHTAIDMRITTTAAAPNNSFIFGFDAPTYNGTYIRSGSFILKLAATNTAKVVVTVIGTAKSVEVEGIGGNTKWSGYLLSL